MTALYKLAAKRKRNNEHVEDIDTETLCNVVTTLNLLLIILTQVVLNLFTLDRYFQTVIFLLSSQINYFSQDKAICQYGWVWILKGNYFLMFNYVIGKFFNLLVKLWVCDSIYSFNHNFIRALYKNIIT